nr:hypothetical protein CFP56_28844 [Quercus suber]
MAVHRKQSLHRPMATGWAAARAKTNIKVRVAQLPIAACRTSAVLRTRHTPGLVETSAAIRRVEILLKLACANVASICFLRAPVSDSETCTGNPD